MAVDRGLGVEALEMTDPAAHHQPDDPLGSRRMRRPAVGGSPVRHAVGTGAPVAMQHGAERQADEAHSQIGQEARRGVSCSIGRLHGPVHRIVTKSL